MLDIKFCPNISKISDIEFRPYMIENAYDYYMTCMTTTHQRMSVQSVICALSIEILLKSFHASITDNKNKLNETYSFNKNVLSKNENAHDLVCLCNALPNEIKSYLFDALDIKTLTDNRYLFTSSRYAYEENSIKTFNDGIMKLAASLICKTIYLYKENGCRDPFIAYFDVEVFYIKHVQSFLWLS
jgi:hypothetical protein